MKKLFSILVMGTVMISCKNNQSENEALDTVSAIEIQTVDLSNYPEDLQKVFAAHGGLDRWNHMQSLTYSMSTEGPDEIQTVDLKSRATLIENEKYYLGYDGERLWVAQDSAYLQPQRAKFYYNLMFYFYAMPFVLADDGITYSATAALEMDGVNYPGIKVSYAANVGNSPDDEYILYYNPSTYEMVWLGYTVTFGQDGKSDKYSFIKYGSWQEVNGLRLPASLEWYKTIDNRPTVSTGKERTFTKVDIDAATMAPSTYSKPEEAVYIQE